MGCVYIKYLKVVESVCDMRVTGEESLKVRNLYSVSKFWCLFVKCFKFVEST